MKTLILALVLSFAAQANALEINFRGASAKFIYTLLSQRPDGVTPGTAKSLLGSTIDTLSLQSWMVCGQKHGWTHVSYKCTLPGTNNNDIAGTHVVNASSDDIAEGASQLNWLLNQTRTLRVNGASASRLYLVLSYQEGKDKSFFKQSGTTKILRNQFEAVGTNEMYCQKTHGRILGDSYKCYINNVTIGDSNAQVTVIVDDPNSSGGDQK